MKKLVLAAVTGMGLALAGMAADKPDDEGFIRNWLLLDPIALTSAASTHEEASQKEFLDKDYFTDQKVATPKASDKAKVADKDLAWKAYASDDAIVNLAKAYEGQTLDNSLFLATVYVTAADEIKDVQLKIGSDDSSMWSLNGKEIKRVYIGRAVERDQDTIEGLTLTKGVNVLRAWVINGEGDVGFCARFTDKDGNPMKNLEVSLVPPPAPAAPAAAK